MTYRFIVVACGTVGLLAACSSDQAAPHQYASWAIGLHVKGSSVEHAVTRSYTQSGDSPAEERKGTIASGDYVGDSSGSLTVDKTTSVDHDWLVVGNTVTENPLVPGDAVFGLVPVYVVEGADVTTGIEIRDEFDQQQQGQVLAQSETRTESNIDRKTDASTWGLAGDEYLVKFEDLGQVWNPDLDKAWADSGVVISGIKYLGKTNVAAGDFWVTPNGNTLCRGMSTDGISLGNTSVSAVRVDLREVANVDDLNLVGRCLVEYDDFDSAYSDPKQVSDHDTRTTVVHLDPGCEGDFVHRKIGSEWWYGNVLVKEDATYYEVKISDWGYQWIDYNAKARKTSHAMPQNVGDVGKFVEFTQTERHVSYATTAYGTSNTPW